MSENESLSFLESEDGNVPTESTCMTDQQLAERMIYYGTVISIRLFVTISTTGFVLVVYKNIVNDVTDHQVWMALLLLYVGSILPCLFAEIKLYRYRKTLKEKQQ